MAAYERSYKGSEGRVAPIDDLEVKQWFIDAIENMYTLQQETIIWEQFINFAMFSSPNFSKATKQYLLDMAQTSPNER